MQAHCLHALYVATPGYIWLESTGYDLFLHKFVINKMKSLHRNKLSNQQMQACLIFLFWKPAILFGKDTLK